MPSDQPGQPILRVIRGDAGTEEIAAILAFLAVRRAVATAATAGTSPAQARSEWSDRSRQVRAPMFPSPGNWRRSALPRG